MKLLFTLAFLGLTFSFAESPAFALQNTHFPIRNFHAVSEGVYRGGNPLVSLKRGQGIQKLLSLNVRAVINLQGGDVDDSWSGLYASLSEPGEKPENIEAEKLILESHGIQFIHLPMNSHAPVDAETELRVQTALQALSTATPENAAFIHCEHGSDRTGLIVALHRVLNQGWSTQSAYSEWAALGHGIVSRYFTGDLDQFFYSFISRPR